MIASRDGQNCSLLHPEREDSSAARGIVRRIGMGRMNQLVTMRLCIQGAVRDGEMAVARVDASFIALGRLGHET